MVQIVTAAARVALGVLLLFFLLAARHAGAQTIPTCTLTAVPSTISGTGRVTLTWTTTGAVLCVASGAWSGVKDCAGGAQGADVNSTRTYTLSARAATGKATATWTKPTQNTDGTPAGAVTGYRLYVADTAAGVPGATPVNLPATPLEYVFWRAPGEMRAGIRGVTAAGEGNLSNIAGKTVTAAADTCTATVTVTPRLKGPALTISWLKSLFTGGVPADNPTNGG